MDKIFPVIKKKKSFGVHLFVVDLVFTFCVLIAWLVMIIIGLFVVAIALPFSHKIGEKNEYGWQMERLPKWAWYWSNDYDGVQGQKNGKNYTDSALDSFWGRYNWTAIRNPANNFSRYTMGVNFFDVRLIEWVGTDPDIDDGIVGWSYLRFHVVGKRFAFPKLAINTGKRVIWIGWKGKSFRYAERPWAGFTAMAFKVDQK